jgi:hypothetical protein
VLEHGVRPGPVVLVDYVQFPRGAVEQGFVSKTPEPFGTESLMSLTFF